MLVWAEWECMTNYDPLNNMNLIDVTWENIEKLDLQCPKNLYWEGKSANTNITVNITNLLISQKFPK